jgi:AraC-like DNA-binding protein
MINRIYSPRAPLSSVVDFFWFDEREAHPILALERMLPTGAGVLIINFHERAIRLFDGVDTGQMQTFTDAIVCGPRSEVFSIDTTTPAAVLGVHFKPGGVFPFFALPVNEMVNAHIPLEALWGKDAGILRERLMAAGSVDEKFRVLEDALLRKACRPFRPHPIVAFAMQEFNNGTRKITDITEQIGFSPQWFRRVFLEEVGLTPKVYYRVQRFQQALRHLSPSQNIDWAVVAQSCGYFDQAHFIHDFQAFMGLSPTAYLSHLQRRLPEPASENG